MTKQVAAVLEGPRRIRVAPLDPSDPASGEIRVALEGSGVCGSDLAAWHGRPWFDYPFEPGAPGHEGWGVVDAVGRDVTDLSVGMRVAVIAQHCYASYTTCPANAAVPLPDDIDGPFPGEPVACAMNVFARSGIEAGTVVAVVGVGFIGALLIQLASAAGARVIAISRRPFSLETAQRAGAHDVVPIHESVVEHVDKITAGEMCEVAIEAAGVQSTLDIAAGLVRERGRLVIAGYHQDGPRTVDMQSWNWRGIDVVNAHERDTRVYVDGLRRGIDAVRDGTIEIAPLITHRFPLHDLAAAFDNAAGRPAGLLKAVVCT